jgi:hypothetical protein
VEVIFDQAFINGDDRPKGLRQATRDRREAVVRLFVYGVVLPSSFSV